MNHRSAMDHRSVDLRRGGSSSSRRRIPEKRRCPERGGYLRSHKRLAAQLGGLANPADSLAATGSIGPVWKSRRYLTRGAGTLVHRGGGRPPGLRRGRPWWWLERRCGFPPSPCAISLTASGSRVRLSVFEENRRQPRCTGSHPERMRPHQWSLPDKTPLGLLAQFGSSRVREDLPRLVRRVGPSRTGSANRSPAPTDTNLVRRSRSMRCGRGKRDLGSP